MARPLALALALSLAAAAAWLARTPPDALAAHLPGLAAEHVDTRALAPVALERHRARAAEEWHARLFLACAALAAGAAVAALAPGLARRLGGSWRAALLTGAVVLLGHAAWRSAQQQLERASVGAWSLADDSLPTYAGELAPRLRAWRATIPEDHAVLLAGLQDLPLNVVATALHPRPLYPLLGAVPADADPATLRAYADSLAPGRDAPGRWLVDLDALARGDDAAAAHPALLRLEP